MAVESGLLREEISGLDALDIPEVPRQPAARRAWRWSWPKLAAVGIVVAGWQLVVLSGWREDYVLPGPGPVAQELARELGTADFYRALGTTSVRALSGYAVAVLIGGVVGALVARSRVLRGAVGSLITGLQTMPSIAWFPLAILLFQLSETAIIFVVVLGAAPSIANGLISGVDNVPPLLLRSGRTLGATGLQLYRHVILPAALPSFLSGLKQGWAFAWRSLMAGELLVVIANRPSIGVRLQFARELSDAPALIASMIVILVIGIFVDSLFGLAERSVRQRRGLVEVTN